MSTNGTPTRRQSPAVYRRRRLVALIVLLAVVLAVVLVVARLASGQRGTADPTTTKAPVTTGTPPVSSHPASSAPPATAADGAPCKDSDVTVEAVTDKTVYDAGQQPKLSMTITNTGKNVCVLDVGTKAQVFTITSGKEKYWTSTDCQTDATDAKVSLKPGVAVSSAAPVIWDRTRSSADTCSGPREAAPAGGASYHLAVSMDGIQSAETKQFLLNG